MKFALALLSLVVVFGAVAADDLYLRFNIFDSAKMFSLEEVESSETGKMLKERIQAKENLPADRQTLYYGNAWKVLDDERTLEEQNIRTTDILWVFVRPTQALEDHPVAKSVWDAIARGEIRAD